MSFKEIKLRSWSDIHKHVKKDCIYRGQREASLWHLETSLERCLKREGISPSKRRIIEERIFREFRRNYHHYTLHKPKEDKVLQWLSIMQHHGAPTRLLDFTYSIYIAAYFALEYAEGDCAVWAVHGPWAFQTSQRLLKQAGKKNPELLMCDEKIDEAFDEIFLKEPAVLCACPHNPFELNERLRVQKGIFMAPGNIEKSFEDNLQAMPGHNQKTNLVKIIIPKRCRKEALRHLSNMNISRTTLFPGLDGYASSLGIISPVYEPVDWSGQGDYHT